MRRKQKESPRDRTKDTRQRRERRATDPEARSRKRAYALNYYYSTKGRYNKAWAKANLELINSRRKAIRSEPRVRFRYARSSAKTRKKKWNLGFETYLILISRPCIYCDGDMSNETGVGLDRIDNSKGYDPYNVIPCCGSCNKIRGDNLTIEETRVAIAAVLEYRRSRK